jgi:hypothetical protein
VKKKTKITITINFIETQTITIVPLGKKNRKKEGKKEREIEGILTIKARKTERKNGKKERMGGKKKDGDIF